MKGKKEEKYFQWCCKIRDAAIRDGLHYLVFSAFLYVVIQMDGIRGLLDLKGNQYLFLLSIIIIVTQMVPIFIILLGHLPITMFYAANIFRYLYRKGSRIRTEEYIAFRPDVTLYREQDRTK